MLTPPSYRPVRRRRLSAAPGARRFGQDFQFECKYRHPSWLPRILVRAGQLSSLDISVPNCVCCSLRRRQVGLDVVVVTLNERNDGRLTRPPRRLVSLLKTSTTLADFSRAREVFPGKADLPVGEREQPAVSDGDAMGIAAEIGQHLFGASKRWLGVDHPVEAPEFTQATCEGLRFG